jgi:hypothetical protein
VLPAGCLATWARIRETRAAERIVVIGFSLSATAVGSLRIAAPP